MSTASTVWAAPFPIWPVFSTSLLLSAAISSSVSARNRGSASAGYIKGRGVRTWRERMAVLEELGFIRVARKASRRFGYVLLPHPHDVVEALRDAKCMPEDWYSAYLDRIEGIGARVGTLRNNNVAATREADLLS